jgi:arylsulfatase A-like enzyme
MPAVLAVCVVLLLAWMGGCSKCADSQEQPAVGSRRGSANVVLITIDTLRADHLRCYGYGEIETPNIDGLARRGYLFEQALSVASITAPSHATILTGTYPMYHGVRDNGNYALAPNSLTLAEILKGKGFSTAAFVSSFVLERRFGIDQGFDTYDSNFEGGASQFKGGVRQWMGHEFDNFERNAALTNEAVFPWLQRNGKRRFFLWVHYFDPHHDYTPPEPWATNYKDRPYDGEIAFADEQLGHLLHELDRVGAAENSLIVVTADHGEGLGEHEKTHGLTLFDPLIRVPLIVVPPKGINKGKRIQRQVVTVDILPTILDLVGVEIPEHVQGSSLRSLMQGGDDLGEAPPPAYSETHRYERPYRGGILRAIRTPRWKLTTREREGERALYDLRNDPKEKRNVMSDHLDTADDLQRLMARMIKDHSPEGKEVDRQFDPSKETMEKLRALGYVQ